MNEYKTLLEKFDRIPRTDIIPPTFMEIAGYPHYENVCSNILAFFFDTTESHQYKDLFLKSFLECVNEEVRDDDLSTIKVTREMPTSSNKRIDIVIETDQLVVAIENKVWASLYNDLSDYANFIDDTYKDIEEKIKVVLSIYPVKKELLINDFINITHSDFLNRVQKNLGHHLTGKTHRYLFQVIDFIETIQNFTKPTTMNKEMIQFFKREADSINNLLEEKNKIQKFIFTKVKELQALTDTENIKANQWIYSKYDLVHDFTFDDGVMIAVDCYLEVEGIAINVWVRKGNVDKIEYLKNLEVYSPEYTFENDRMVVQNKKDMDLLTDTEVIANKLAAILKEINKKAIFTKA